MKRNIICLFLLIIFGLISWSKVLTFWFFRGWEAGWLMGAPHTFFGLFRFHAFIYFLDYKLFGWQPSGWYATALIFHLLATAIIFFFILSWTKNHLLAFLTSLIFVANIAYHDVLTWGSFNSYYPLILLGLVSVIWSLHQFHQKRKKIYYLIALLISFATLFFRETGIVILGLIPLYQIIFNKEELNRNKIMSMIKIVTPFILIVLLYLMIRNIVGGGAGDFADDTVQMRLKLLEEGQYFVYGWRVFIAFGKFFAPLIWPYPFLNYLRQIILSVNSQDLIFLYFFPLVGWATLVGLIVILWKLKRKNYIKLLLFAFGWMVFQILFISLAMPSTDTVLRYEYLWNTRRYEYYAFFGTSLFLAILFYQIYLKRKMLFYLIMLIFIGGNIVALWTIEDNLAREIYKPSKDFYQKFKDLFPSLPKKAVIYQYPYANGLNDFLYEWSFFKGDLYKNLAGEPFRTESQLERVLEKISQSQFTLNDTIFLDYNPRVGLIDQTQKAREMIVNTRTFTFNGTSQLDMPQGKLPVEIPYQIEINFKALPLPLNEDSFLKFYALDRYQFLQNVKVKVSATASQRQGEPFLFFVPENLIDGNFGPRSTWIADSVPAVITLDLGQVKQVKAILWSTLTDSPRRPSNYEIFLSENGQDWQKVKEVKLNKDYQRIDILDTPHQAKFVRLTVQTTQSGGFNQLDELEVIDEEAAAIFKKYTDPQKLITDSQKMTGLPFGWAKITWQTSKDKDNSNPQEYYFPFKSDGLWHTYTISLPEREYLSQPGEFLDKFITSIDIEPVTPSEFSIGQVKIFPKYEINHP